MTFAKKRIRIVCPEGGSKILFPSYNSAEVYLGNMKKRSRHPENFKSTRIYYCKSCGGYHTSTSTQDRLDRMSPKARAEAIHLRNARKYSPQKVHDAEIPPKDELRLSSREKVHTAMIGRIYRHFKGDYYQILAIARHTETKESMVIYQLLYHKKKKVWARPLKDFISEVDHEKYPDVRQRYRFELQESCKKSN